MSGIEVSKSLKTRFCKKHEMAEKIRKVVFASKAMESDYKRLSSSENPEDKRLHEVLRRAREMLQSQYRLGREIPKHEIPAIYQRMFRIDNLWELKTTDHETIFYSVVGDEIWIVDMV